MAGDPIKLPNVVCCHEIDDGILWKHTNYRTGNAVVTRSRILVLQTIITVGNYEYIFAFQFTQDASINYEVRATGILSTAPINLGDSVSYGTIVGPGVMAPYHQHLFSLRIDPAIDGHRNSLIVEESHPMPIDDPNVHNPFGVDRLPGRGERNRARHGRQQRPCVEDRQRECAKPDHGRTGGLQTRTALLAAGARAPVVVPFQAIRIR
ncbi:hypothetical protein VTN96DRAFT_7811 [Rasamsonia emersonii]